MTRVKDEQRGEILIFKEAEWQTLRIETNALVNPDASDEERILTTPLRLIANQSKVRITMKKRLAGSFKTRNIFIVQPRLQSIVILLVLAPHIPPLFI